MSEYLPMGLPPKPQGKFNDWCERKPLVFPDDSTYRKAISASARKDLSPYEQAFLYHHLLTGCMGIEFVILSNCRIDSAQKLAGGVWIVPCFLEESSEVNELDILAQRTRAMNSAARFVYDGWLGLDRLGDNEIRHAIRAIDTSLGLFSLLTRSRFRWHPKYGCTDNNNSVYHIKDEHLDVLSDMLVRIDNIPDSDRKAIMRSIGWLSQSVRNDEPFAKFLASVLAIESLAMYIESEAEDGSVLSSLAIDTRSKAEKKRDTRICIQSKLDTLLKSDPAAAIRAAYFDCVVGIKKTLEQHVRKVLGSESEGVRLLFGKLDGQDSLYDIRHRIAHGRLDAISDFERHLVDLRVWDVERTARRYILAVVNRTLGTEYEPPTMTASVSIPLTKMVVSDASMCQWPTHMGLIYS